MGVGVAWKLGSSWLWGTRQTGPRHLQWIVTSGFVPWLPQAPRTPTRGRKLIWDTETRRYAELCGQASQPFRKLPIKDFLLSLSHLSDEEGLGSAWLVATSPRLGPVRQAGTGYFFTRKENKLAANPRLPSNKAVSTKRKKARDMGHF